MKYKVGITCSPGIHITHNDSDGIGCAIVTKYLAEYYSWDDDCDVGDNGRPRFPTTHDYDIHFHSIHSALNAVKKLITTIMDIMKGGYDDDLDLETVLRYYLDDKIAIAEQYSTTGVLESIPAFSIEELSIPEYIYVSDLPITEELVDLIQRYRSLSYDKPHIYNRDAYKARSPKVLWFDHHESSKRFATEETKDWFIHSSIWFPGENISAAELMSRYFQSYNIEHSVSRLEELVLGHLIPDISRYDTWEWRRNPKSDNVDDCNEWQIQALISAYKNPMTTFLKISECINNYCENDNISPDEALSTYPEFNMIFNIRNVALKSAINSAKRNYRLVKLMEIDYDAFDDLDYNVALMISDSPYGSLVMESIYNADPDIDIVISIYPVSRSLSFRCSYTRSDIHLNEIAERIGGGGHPAAAGAHISKELMLHILDLYYSFDPD